MNKKLLALVVASFFIGVLWFAALRFVLIQDKTVHYHANFGLYVNGKKDPFDSFTQYEEVQACSGNTTDNPRGRAHLHKPNPHVVHVHDNAVTWSAFFANVGYGISDKALTTTDGIFVEGQDGKHLSFILNGEKVQTVANRIIGNKDALLISYGDDTEEALKKQYDDIPKDAEKVNSQYDPASCSGTKPMGIKERLQAAFTLTK
jgi:hypothetical protein